jgi:hypothetical protein
MHSSRRSWLSALVLALFGVCWPRRDAAAAAPRKPTIRPFPFHPPAYDSRTVTDTYDAHNRLTRIVDGD